jgi:hypothetical protein
MICDVHVVFDSRDDCGVPDGFFEWYVRGVHDGLDDCDVNGGLDDSDVLGFHESLAGYDVSMMTL